MDDGVHTTSTAEETGHLLGFVPGKHLRNKHLSLIFCANYSENKSRAVVQDNGENTLMRKEIKITKSCSLSLGHWVVCNIDAQLKARTQMIYIYAQSEKQTEQSNKDETFLGIVLVICVHCWSIMGEGVAGLLLPI